MGPAYLVNALPVGAMVLLVVASALLIALATCRSDSVAVAGILVLSLVVVIFPSAAIGLVSIGPLRDVAVFAVAGVLLVAVAVLRLPPPTPPLPVLLFGAAFAVVLLVSSWANGSNVVSFGAHWLLWLCAFVLGLAVPTAQRRVLLGGWVAIGVALASYAVYEHWARPPSIFADILLPGYRRSVAVVSGVEQYRSQATFGHPVPLGSFLAATFALVAGTGRREGTRAAKLLRFAVLVLLLLGSAFTFARTGWISLSAAVLVVPFVRRLSGGARNRAVLVALAAIACVLISPVGERIVDYVEGTSETSGYQSRVGNLRTVPEVASSSVADMVMGRGAGAGEEFVTAHVGTLSQGTSAVDNQYVTLLLESGVLGLASFVGLLAVALLEGVRQARVLGPGAGDPVPLLAAATALLVAMFFFELLYWPATAVLFWCILGMLCRPPQPKASEAKIRSVQQGERVAA